MGARPSSFKKGGGFLNNVDGTITDYEFSDEVPSKDGRQPFKPGKDPKTGKERFHTLYCYLSARADGAEEDVTTALFAGGADDWDITEDGHVLVPTEDGRQLGASTAFAILLNSMVEAGFPEDRLPEEDFDFRAIIGTRVRFVQRKNEDATKRLGKRKDAKTGKEYDRQDLVVDQVYDLPSTETKSNGKAAKPNGKAAAPAAKGKGKQTEPEVDLAELAGTALQEILGANKGEIAKNKLSLKLLTTPCLKGNDHREDVRKWIFDDDNLATLVEAGVIAYNKSKGILSAVED